MKNVVFWDVALLPDVSVEHIAIFRVEKSASEEPAWEGSSETSVNTRPTQHHIPEDDILLCYYFTLHKNIS
jgi:hypothetical protein